MLNFSFRISLPKLSIRIPKIALFFAPATIEAVIAILLKEDDVAHIIMDATKSVLQETLHVGQMGQSCLEMLRDSINPVFSMRIGLDFLVVFIELKGDLELEALGSAEPLLHHSITGHSHDVLFIELGVRVLSALFHTKGHILSVDQWFARACLNFFDSESHLVFELLD